MQFKHPEILWALVLLLIPILIHLFQLRRFKKTPFTNVAMLQQVVSESRKSNTLKKWLLLLTRLLLIAAIIIAFAQPFSSKKTALQQKETVVYLDDSFSMQAKSNGLSLLEKAVQELIKNSDPESVFSLFTNEKTYREVTIRDIQNNLLSLPHSHRQLGFNEIQLKANTLFSKSTNTIKDLILLSDFQESMYTTDSALDSATTNYLVPIRPKETRNISLDSIYLTENQAAPASLSALLSGGADEENVPISLYDGEVLIAKTSAKFNANGKAEVTFTIPEGEELNGTLKITDNGLSYDNQFFFNINKKDKIKVLVVHDSNSNYLNRLFNQKEFTLNKYTLRELDYSTLGEQNVVVLDNLPAIPNSLQKVLRTFKENGGTIIVIPSVEIDLTSYNQFLTSFFATQLIESNDTGKKITTISFEHPLYQNVFEKKVYNFQYPNVKRYYKTRTRAPKILSLESGEAFLSGIDGFYLFSAALETDNSNFKNSPLIVPTFYNMAALGLKISEPYHNIGQATTVDISLNLGTDDILNVSKEGYEFIPFQQSFPNKVRLSFNGDPTVDGIFSITRQGQSIQNISFNYPRTESKLSYLDLESIGNTRNQDSIASLFEFLEAESSITAYWKWFVILALLLALIEVIIQKFVT
ncbi:BatA domain-containing protein [Flagellimonas sp. 389]|uniref:BatA domain-containing protein n=1 Tax=Flagellimonas sp. 389 TaxID=2835862 RepID=UPI001BD4FCE3|nr:BatA domain-containing protein [Flagellimonas sp. 389]MBS9462047.1 BatA domain-containing protein [Flagellimonas sp. 389]